MRANRRKPELITLPKSLALVSTMAFALEMFCMPSVHAEAGKLLWSGPQGSVVERVQEGGADDGYAGIEVRKGTKVVFPAKASYLQNTVDVLWRRKPGSQSGPDVIVGGYTGGSHCGFDVITVSLESDPAVQTIFVCWESVPVTEEGGLPSLNVGLEVEAIPLSANTRFAELPLRWNGKKLAIDVMKLVTPDPDARTLARLHQSIRQEVGKADTDYTSTPLMEMDLPETTQALMDLIFSGHADIAKRVLFEDWPLSIKGREVFWRELSTALTRHRYWKQLSLGELPNCLVVVESAAPNPPR